MELFLTLVFGILGIILFFKIWIMTNDIRAIKDRLTEVFPTNNEKAYEKLHEAAKTPEVNAAEAASSFALGETVKYAPMNRIMIIKSIHADGKIECVSYKKDGSEEFEGLYEPSQIEHI